MFFFCEEKGHKIANFQNFLSVKNAFQSEKEDEKAQHAIEDSDDDSIIELGLWVVSCEL